MKNYITYIFLGFIDFILFSYLFTACCAVSLCMATERFINNTTPVLINPLHFFIFGSTLIIYNLPIITNSKNRMQVFSVRGLFFIIGILITVSVILKLSFPILICSLILGIFSIAYSIPILPFKQKKRLRDFGWLKIIDLTGVWTIATSIIPILFWEKNIIDYPFEIIIRFVFVFALCILFDLRDMRIDYKNNIDTLPHKIGKESSYKLIDFIIFLFLILSVLQFLRFHLVNRLIVSVITAIVLKIVIVYIKKYPSNRAYLGLADGVMLFYSVLALL